MIDKQQLTSAVAKAIEGTDAFIVDLKAGRDNSLVVELDSPTGMDIDACAEITRRIEATLDRDVEDYDLEVGTAGLTSPFKVRGQYEKYLGQDVEIVTTDGRKLRGRLESIDDSDTPTVTVAVTEKVRQPGQKRPVLTEVMHTLTPAERKSIRYDLQFK